MALFPRLPLLTMWPHCTMNILGAQNSSDIVMPPGKLTASVQPLVFILLRKNIDELQISCSLKKDFIPMVLPPFVTPVFKREDPRNYRLVSPTLIPGKVMKQIILGTTPKHIKDKRWLWADIQIYEGEIMFTHPDSCLWRSGLESNRCCLCWL